MATFNRQVGVFGANLPTKKSRSVSPADFTIGGMICALERMFKQVFVAQSPNDVAAICGAQVVTPNASLATLTGAGFGWDAINGFFANAAGVPAKLYFMSHVNSVSPVSASQIIQNLTPVTLLTLTDGYNDSQYPGIVGYGLNGNRTGYTILFGDRVNTTATVGGSVSDTWVTVANPGAFRVGDCIKMIFNGGTPGTIYRLVTSIDYVAGRLNFAGATTPAFAVIGDVVTALGFQLHTWRKDLVGTATEVDVDLGKVWCSPYAACSDFYVLNVFSKSKWWNIVRASTTPATPNLDFPATQATITYPVNGSDGTCAANAAAEFASDYAYFNALPIRLLANPETTDVTAHKAMETYCRGRTDNPKVIINFPSAQTKSQCMVNGGTYQRTDDVLMVGWDKWLVTVDPFAKSTNAPYRNVPNVGHMMGYILRCINLLGIHYAPAQKSQPLYGCNDVLCPVGGDPTLLDGDRTDILNTGMNVIQNMPGLGIIPRNAVTPSTSLEFIFFNGLLMREFIKNSAVQSLQSSENTPNSLNRVREDKMAILAFLYRLWNQGSTGNAPVGETFGQWMAADGTMTKPEDHFEVKADTINNPIDQLQLGNRNLDVYFTYPAPGQSIRIGVGILLKSA
jgi:hypothetical protein